MTSRARERRERTSFRFRSLRDEGARWGLDLTIPNSILFEAPVRVGRETDHGTN